MTWTSERVVSPDRGVAEAQLLRLWREIEWWLEAVANQQAQHRGTHVDGSDVQPLLKRWVVLFREELDYVRRARNSIAHAVPLSDDALFEAVHVARRLLALLYSKVPEEAAQEMARHQGS